MSRRLVEAARLVRIRALNAYNDADTVAASDDAELVMDLAALVVRVAEEAEQAEARADAAGLGR